MTLLRKRGAHKIPLPSFPWGRGYTAPPILPEVHMKVGDIVKVNGRDVKVTFVNGTNYSYAPVEKKEAPQVEVAAEEVKEEEPKAKPK